MGLEKDGQEGTKPRRKVVITKKRLLSITSAIEPSTVNEPVSLTQISQEHQALEIDNEPYTEDPLSEYDDEDDYGDDDETEEEYEDLENATITPEYEPFFPELNESTDVPVLLLKTTVISTLELETKTTTTTEIQTITSFFTQIVDGEEIVTSSTEVRPQLKTTQLTETSTIFTTLTLLDLDDVDKTIDVQPTFLPTLEYNPSSLSNSEDTDFREEPRNLATRVMSNGVEVIVAGDKTTYPGDKDFKRIIASSQKPVTLKPSTLSDHMLLLLPSQESSSLENPSSQLDPNQFVVKTCLTTFTYLTTYLEKGTTTVSSHEQVVSNVATEERLNTGKILPTPAIGITLTQYPTLSVGVFHTTYTYLNTILDGEQPLVISSQHIVANTVTAPDDYLSLLQPSKTQTPVKNTNTYISTINLEKTIYEGDNESVISTRDVVTQVVITESVPQIIRPVTTSYIALDEDKIPSTTDLVKTYFVTYTYFNTLMDKGTPMVVTNVSTESDVVTEKVLLQPKKTIGKEASSQKHNEVPKFEIVATRVYYTTFTYFTTLLKENDPKRSTIINSRTKVVENTVTETLEPSLFDSKYLQDLSKDLKVHGSVQKLATLLDGEELEITVQANEDRNEITPSKVLPIEKTSMASLGSAQTTLEGSFSSSKPNVITGSTIVFVDDDPFANLATPTLNKISSTQIKTSLGSLLASEVVKETKVDIVTSKIKRQKNKSKNKAPSPTKTLSQVESTNSNEMDIKKLNKKPTQGKISVKQPSSSATDLLGLGSININTLQVLTPVLNAMAGYIDKNLKGNRRNDVNHTNERTPQITQNKKDTIVPVTEVQNRSPVYIPVGGAVGDDFEIAESQNIATFEWNDPPGHGMVKQEAPLLGNNGIPISPGDIITANSDVIVGKPGRVGPRLPPSIPLHQDASNEVPLGMKPPPLPEKQSKTRKTNTRLHIPLLNDQIPSAQMNVIHAPNKDDYVGPPPPPRQTQEKLRGEKRKHIPLNFARPNNNVVIRNPPTTTKPNLQDISSDFTNNQLIYNQQPVVVPSIPIVLPEVVERSTGQPLLVQLQPSQVAFVNIPFNRTTALIYGGSTETHHNGQYFDDPSPYPEPEFNGFKNNVQVQLPQIYQQENTPQVNQKQVSGVIKVGPYVQMVNRVKLEPSRINNNAEVNVNAPPISFGSSEQNALKQIHGIKNAQESPKISLSFQNSSLDRPSSHKILLSQEILNPPPLRNNPHVETYNHEDKKQVPYRINSKPKYPYPPKRVLRPRPTKLPAGISQFMAPPPLDKKLRPSSYASEYLPETHPVHNTQHPEDFNKKEILFEDHHLEDDLANEDGEVVQESNIQPLRPGEIPLEVLRRESTTTERVPDLIKFPDRFANSTHVRFPYKEYARPEILHERPPHLSQKQHSRPQFIQFQHDYNSEISMHRPELQLQTEENNLLVSQTLTTKGLTSTTTAKQRVHSSSTEKPILIFIDENGPKQPNQFFHKNPRPKVTSLPIDPQTKTSITEKPPQSVMTTPSLELSQEINNMEVLHPPPMEVPSVSMEPPKINESPSTPFETASPTKATTEIVIGMNPPPMVSSTHKPVYSLEVDVPKEPTTYRPRVRPSFRRPSSRRTTVGTTTKAPTPSTTTRRPTAYQNYLKTTRNNPKLRITPSPTVKTVTLPSLEVIVGEPQVFHKKEQVKIPVRTSEESTPALPPMTTVQEILKPVHHAGNEVKIMDDLSRTTVEESRLLPTRYITHTKTLTVTITKTSVIKTDGGPPSTLTILVTKTEKSYIVDTVTEFHTLLKPTSIVETVTTTVEKDKPLLYLKDIYKSTYPYLVTPTATAEIPKVTEHHLVSSHDEDDSLEEFIIKESDRIQDETNKFEDNESIFVVMTDKNKGAVIKMPPPNSEEDVVPNRDEVQENDVNNVLIAGILSANHPEPIEEKNQEKCSPDCKPSRNELCQKVKGIMRCVCRPGFARMFPDRPCNPTYTYSLNVTLDKIGKTRVKYSPKLQVENTTEFVLLARKVHESLDRMVMQSDLRDIFHGVHISSFYPSDHNDIISEFYLQLSENIDEVRMTDIFKKYLRNSNYSLGGTEVVASSRTVDDLKVHDFNECTNARFHDCSENAQCFNLRGTYTCSCREGYSDLSENMLYPGRVCSADQVGCEKCNYHGACYTRGSDEILCECFHWYSGERCHINLKVLLIGLVTLGTILFALLLVCIIMVCARKKPRKKSAVSGTIAFLPQRNGHTTSNGTLDRRAMIEDCSSEDSRSDTNSVPPYVQQKHHSTKLKPPPAKGALKKVSMTSVEHSEPAIIFPDQKDRSLTVMIPRAKYHPAPPNATNLSNYTTFEARNSNGVPSISTEAKLLSYLDAGPSPSKSDSKRKFSNAVSEQLIEEQSTSRKTSGALISAGFEVSATVINNMGTLGTTCGTEADRSENATLIQKISADLLSTADTSSQFNTLRKSLVYV